MNLESIKEQLLERWNSIWERVRDSDTYIQLRERYQNLSPTMQKTVIWTGIAVLSMIVLFIPYSFYSSGSESVETFENNVRLVREYYRVQRELASTPNVPETPASSAISSQVSSALNQLGLGPEQISGPREIAPERENTNALQPPGITEHGVEVTLLKLNLRQVTDVGTRLSQLGQGLHLTSLDLKANAQNDHYFDVIFRVTGFSMPGAPSTSGASGAAPLQDEAAPPPRGAPPKPGSPSNSPGGSPGRARPTGRNNS